jgi:hypothetical protein
LSGTKAAYVPDLLRCGATGKTEAAVRRRIQTAIEVHLRNHAGIWRADSTPELFSRYYRSCRLTGNAGDRAASPVFCVALWFPYCLCFEPGQLVKSTHGFCKAPGVTFSIFLGIPAKRAG